MRGILLAVAAAAAAGCGQRESPVANDDSVSIFLGRAATIDVLANDAVASNELSSVEVVAGPLAGVVKIDPASGAIGYRHNGISAAPDTFSYRVRNLAGAVSNAATVTVVVGVPDARVEILHPVAGAELRGDTVTVNYTVSGSGFNHLHLALDGEGHNTIKDLTGTYTFTGVGSGSHVVSAELVDADHRPINTPASTHAVSISVAK